MVTKQTVPIGKTSGNSASVMIGSKEISNAVKAGKIKKVVVANNCPKHLIEKLGNIEVEVFDGDQMQLGTKLGKPFPIAMVGLKDITSGLK